MSKRTDVSLREVTSDTERIAYRTPMKFGGRVVTDVVLLSVTVEVETRDGRRGRGFGSMPMGNVWGWPSQCVPAAKTLAAMVELGQPAGLRGQSIRGMRSSAGDHPRVGGIVPVGSRRDYSGGRPDGGDAAAGATRGGQPAGSRHPRRLRQGAGRRTRTTCWGRSSSAATWPPISARSFAGEYLDRYMLPHPKPHMPLYHLIGALDPLTRRGLAGPAQRRPAGDACPSGSPTTA